MADRVCPTKAAD